MKYFCVLLIPFLFFSCKDENMPFSAQSSIDKAIEVTCQGNCDQATIQFTFRGKKYKSERTNGSFRLERIFTDSTGSYQDILTNEEFLRYRNDSIVKLQDSTVMELRNSVNSVHYFAQLPYGLNAPAAQKKLVGDTAIRGLPYYEISVTFSEEGGGTDYEDRFMYWINKKTYTVDYLAYSYAVNGGGIRFREAYNPRTVNGIRFVDYNNYKPADLNHALTDLPDLFEKGQLTLLSKIELEDVTVTVDN